MKLKYSLFSRRLFLDGLFGGWISALGAALLYPALRFLFPPAREVDQVLLPGKDFADLPRNSVKPFAWGAKPGLLKRNDDGSLSAFVAVCTHLDCNVKYLPEARKFFCACHDGWYDESGVNVAGPPPRPLRRLEVAEEGENLIVRREAKS